MKQLAIIGSATLLSGSLAVFAPAKALDFNFSFGGVEGIIRGLTDNQSDQTTNPPTSVEVLVSPNGGLGTYAYSSGSGFQVTNGVITKAAWNGVFASPIISGLEYTLRLCTDALGICPDRRSVLFANPDDVVVPQIGQAIFTPSPVPGPVPLLGAAAALAFSRKLRQRINSD